MKGANDLDVFGLKCTKYDTSLNLIRINFQKRHEHLHSSLDKTSLKGLKENYVC